MLTALQKAIGELESELRFLQPDPLRFEYSRKELLDQLDHIKKLASPKEKTNGND
jgi:hypothetical protein|tara:strand:+ start:1147 stop:1311 length:165 start_codon:yes stop_codon:yes gene_type:complete